MNSNVKRLRKTKLVAREMIDSDEEIIKLQNEVERTLLKYKPKPTPEVRPSISTEPPPIQLSVKVEVENLNEEQHEELPRVTFQEVLQESLEIVSRSSSVVNRLFHLQVLNSIKPDPITFTRTHQELLLDKALQRWADWSNISEFYREPPLYYKCYICTLAWWHLHDFSEHLKLHNFTSLRINVEIDDYVICNIVAFIDRAQKKYIGPVGKCWRCGELGTEHKTAKKCQGCQKQFSSCSMLREHQWHCDPFKKMNIHLFRNAKKIHKCHLCRFYYFQPSDLLEHMVLRHSVRSDVPILVPKSCDKCFSVREAHVCERPYMESCKRCKKTLYNRCMANIHKEVLKHCLMCPFSDCNFRVIRECQLYDHLEVHTNDYEAVHKCLICKKLVLLDANCSYRHTNEMHDYEESCKYELVYVPKTIAEKIKYISEENEIGPIRTRITTPNRTGIRKSIEVPQISELGNEVVVKTENDEEQMDIDDPVNSIDLIQDRPPCVIANIKTESDTQVVSNLNAINAIKQFPSLLLNQIAQKAKQSNFKKIKIVNISKYKGKKDANKLSETSKEIKTNAINGNVTDKNRTKPNVKMQVDNRKDNGNFEINITNDGVHFGSSKTNDAPVCAPTEIGKQVLLRCDEIKKEPISEAVMQVIDVTDKTNDDALNSADLHNVEINTLHDNGETSIQINNTNTIDHGHLNIGVKNANSLIKLSNRKNVTNSLVRVYTDSNSEHSNVIKKIREKSLQKRNLNITKNNDINNKGVREGTDFEAVIDAGSLKKYRIKRPTVTNSNIEVEVNYDSRQDPEETEMDLRLSDIKKIYHIDVDVSPNNEISLKRNISEIDVKTEVEIENREMERDNGHSTSDDEFENDLIIIEPADEIMELSDDDDKIEDDDNDDDEYKSGSDDQSDYSDSSSENGERIYHKTYRCKRCQFSGNHKQFVRHKRTVCQKQSREAIEGHASYKCTKCNATFSSFRRYAGHFETHGYAALSCPKCFQKKQGLAKLERHMTSHLKDTFITYRAINSPDEVHKSKYMCKICNTSLKKAQFFRHWEAHLELLNTTKTSEKIQTRTCDPKIRKVLELFTNADKLNDATKKYFRKCLICNRAFSRRNDCKRHIIEHLLAEAYRLKPKTGPLQCLICSETFDKPIRFRGHMRLHASLPVYKCELCDKTFSDSSNFSKHKKVHNFKTMVCDICGKKFSNKIFLIKHMEYHARNPPIECDKCGKTYFSQSQFRKHYKNAHDKSRLSFKCQQCLTMFRTLKEKWDHMWNVHQERRTSADCPYCPAKFRKMSQVKKHVAQEHIYNIIKENPEDYRLEMSPGSYRLPTVVIKTEPYDSA